MLANFHEKTLTLRQILDFAHALFDFVARNIHPEDEVGKV
jgi:hypothetical protein